MAIFRDRLTRQEIIQLFAFAAFPIHIWTIISTLRDVPSWMLYMSAWDITGTIAYSLAFALFETLLVFFSALSAAILLPKRWVSYKFAAVASVIILEASIIAPVLQVFIVQFVSKRALFLVSGAVMAVSIFAVIRSEGIHRALNAVASRLSVLSFIYVSFDLIGLMIVIGRNI